MTCVQLFCSSPFAVNLSSEKHITTNVPSVYSHLPYVLNLAGHAKTNSIAWTGNMQVDDYVTKCTQRISDELALIGSLGCTKGCGCVLHIGSIGNNPQRQLGLKSVAASINRIAFRDQDSSQLLLETMVGNKGVLGCSFEELRVVYEELETNVKPRVGFCIDTCHVFAQGLYDLSDCLDVDQMFAHFDAMLPRESLKLIHLNDSKECMGSHKDHHANITTGHIWGKQDAGLVHLLKQAKQRNLGVVLETEENDWGRLQELLIKSKLL